MQNKNILQEYFQKKHLSLPDYESKQVGIIDNQIEWQSRVTLADGRSFVGDVVYSKKAAESSAAANALAMLAANPIYSDSSDEIKHRKSPKNNTKPIYSDLVDEMKYHKLSKKKTRSVKNNSDSSDEVKYYTTKKKEKYKLKEIESSEEIVKNNLQYEQYGESSEEHVVNKRAALLIDIENLHKFHKFIPEKDYDLIDVYIFVGKHKLQSDWTFHKKVHKIISPSTRPNGTDSCIHVFVGLCLAKEAYDIYFIATRDAFGDNLVEMINSNNLGWCGKEAYVVTKYQEVYQYL